MYIVVDYTKQEHCDYFVSSIMFTFNGLKIWLYSSRFADVNKKFDIHLRRSKRVYFVCLLFVVDIFCAEVRHVGLVRLFSMLPKARFILHANANAKRI